MPNTERCRQQITGSCTGCNVLEIVKGRVRKGVTQENAVQTTQAEYCPDGTTIQIDKINPMGSTNWGNARIYY